MPGKKKTRLIQLFLPLSDNRGKAFPRRIFAEVERTLAQEFSGLTAYTQSPAKGLWKKRGELKQDKIVVYEVMAPLFARKWWKRYRADLEKTFRQDAIVVRTFRMETI